MKININNLFFYLLLTVIFFLSGNYFGENFYYINIFMILIIAFDILHLLLSIKYIYFNQNFSTEHPQKGDLINYSNYLKNSLPIMSSPITVEYNKYLKLENDTFIIAGKKSINIEQVFSLPFRGVYEVGYKSIYIRDILNIFQISRPIWKRTFYVYPRLKELNIYSIGKGKESYNKLDLMGLNRDSLESIKNYLPGSKNSLISWKHFAALGEPYIKDFSSINSNNLSLFIDRTLLPEHRLGPVDDKVLEVSISIINSLLKKGEKVTISNSRTLIDNYSDFNDYYKSTIFEEFNLPPSSSEKEFKNSCLNSNDPLIIITPLENSYFISKELFLKYPKTELIIISKLMKKSKRKSIQSLLEKNKIREDKVHWID